MFLLILIFIIWNERNYEIFSLCDIFDSPSSRQELVPLIYMITYSIALETRSIWVCVCSFVRALNVVLGLQQPCFWLTTTVKPALKRYWMFVRVSPSVKLHHHWSVGWLNDELANRYLARNVWIVVNHFQKKMPNLVDGRVCSKSMV